MSDHGDTQLDVQTTRKPRRVAAILLSFLSAGLGHVAIGYWRRAIFWYGVLLCTVLGDHRDHSRDSRDFGALPIALVESKARLVWWSSGPEGVRWSRINQRVE
jgi:hypothetical protein